MCKEMSITGTNGDGLKNYDQDEIRDMLKESQNLYCPFCGEMDFEHNPTKLLVSLTWVVTLNSPF